jgi:hypothetical protein
MASGQLELWTHRIAADGGHALRLTEPRMVSYPPPATSIFARRTPEGAHGLGALHELDARAQFFFDRARATNRRTAYERDFTAFERW